jgi:hypothetical protein
MTKPEAAKREPRLGLALAALALLGGCDMFPGRPMDTSVGHSPVAYTSPVMVSPGATPQAPFGGGVIPGSVMPSSVPGLGQPEVPPGTVVVPLYTAPSYTAGGASSARSSAPRPTP